MTQNNASLESGSSVELLNLLRPLAAHWSLLLVMPIIMAAVAYGASFLIAPTFTSNTSFLPPQQGQSAAMSVLQSLGALGGLAGAATGIKNPSDQYISLLKSRTVRDALIAKLQLKERYETELNEDTLDALDAKVRISGGKDGLITIEVEDKNPAFSAKLANAHVEELGILLDRLALTEAQQRRQFFEKQLLVAKANLAKAEIELRNSGVNASVLKASPTMAVSGLAQLQAQIAATEVRLASMREYMTDNAAAVRQVLSELAALRSERNKLAASESSGNPETADYVARYRDVKYHETLFELLAKQYELAKVDEARDGGLIQVVDKAIAPEKKSKPRRGMLVIVTALVTGLLIVILLLLLEFRRRVLSDAEEAARRSAS